MRANRISNKALQRCFLTEISFSFVSLIYVSFESIVLVLEYTIYRQHHQQEKRHSSDDKSNISNGQKLKSEGEMGVLGIKEGFLQNDMILKVR